MSPWTHALCDDCYAAVEPGREPVRMLLPEDETCCRCREETKSGIYYRADPKTMHCKPGH